MAPSELETVPLLQEATKEKSKFDEKEVVVIQTLVGVAEAPVKKRAFIFQRVTYYWILVVSQFLQATLCIAMFAVSVADKTDKTKKTYKEMDMLLKTLASGLYSLLGLVYAVVILISHYNGNKTKLNAGRHVSIAKACFVMGAINFLLFFRPVMTAYAHVDFANDDIKRFFVPVVVLLLGFSILAAGAAAFITKRSAKRALGTEMVNDPNHRVPAWTLATTVDENGIRLA